MLPWVCPSVTRCRESWDTLGQEGGGGLRAPPGRGEDALGGLGKGPCWLPLPLPAGRRFCNPASSPGGIKRAAAGRGAGTSGRRAQVRDPPAGLAGPPGPGAAALRSTALFGVTPGFAPVPGCSPVTTGLGRGEDPRFGGTASGEFPGCSTGEWGFPRALPAPQNPAEPPHMWAGLGAGVGCSGCQRGCLVRGAWEAAGGGSQGCARGSPGVPSPRGIGDTLWGCPRGGSVRSHFLAQR